MVVILSLTPSVEKNNVLPCSPVEEKDDNNDDDI